MKDAINTVPTYISAFFLFYPMDSTLKSIGYKPKGTLRHAERNLTHWSGSCSVHLFRSRIWIALLQESSQNLKQTLTMAALSVLGFV